jgi:hypothetical protein
MVRPSPNGPPFASLAAGGLSRLSVWWIKLGITPVRIMPGKPQQNGRHERMHKTLKAETAQPPAATLAAQQRRFDHFRAEFNHERPHEALGQAVPAAVYTPAPRPYPARLQDPAYASDFELRRVRGNGEIKWQGELIFIAQPLVGEVIGLHEMMTATPRCTSDRFNWVASTASLSSLNHVRAGRSARVLGGELPTRPTAAGIALRIPAVDSWTTRLCMKPKCEKVLPKLPD